MTSLDRAKLIAGIVLLTNAARQLQELSDDLASDDPATKKQASTAAKACELASVALEDLTPELRRLGRRKR